MTTEYETKPFITINLPHEISEDRIRDLLCGALEGGSNYWYEPVNYELRAGLKIEDFLDGGSQTLDEYWQPIELIPFVDGCQITLQVQDEGDNCDLVGKTFPLNREKMKDGIKIMAEKYPEHFHDFITEDNDSVTSDVFLQCSLFGKVVFG